ncbi:MAG: hypothetical protein KA151_03185 [Piscinibacter sp.]|nr:hypothetical protein [Piscinibacter sp.]
MASNPVPTPATATLAELRSLPAARAQTSPVAAGFFDAQGFELLQRVAKAFASSSLVPAAYQGNLPNCMIALNLARRLKADELMVMQNLYIVHGNPGWSAKFLVACINSCGRFSALRYEWRGTEGKPEFGCRAWAVERETGERLNGAWVDLRMVKAEGWDAKKGSKWLTMPEQMFMYRAAAFWQRAYAPEISMGLSTAEELADVVDVHADGTYTVTSEALRSDLPPAPHVDAKPPVPTFDALASMIAGAQSLDALAEIRNLVPSVEFDDDRDELLGMLEVRAAELTPND